MHIDVFIYLLICLFQSPLRISPRQGQNNQTFGVSLVSVRSIEKVTSTGNKSRNIVTGGKRHSYASKLHVLFYTALKIARL